MKRLHGQRDLVAVHAVERGEDFAEVAVVDEQPGGQQHLRQVVQMPLGDEVAQRVDSAAAECPAPAPWRIRRTVRRRRRTAERSSSASPAATPSEKSSATMLCTENTSGTASPASSRLNVSKRAPVPRLAAPAQRQAGRRSICLPRVRARSRRRGEVRNQPDVQVQDRHDQIGQDREEIPLAASCATAATRSCGPDTANSQ